MMKAPRIASYAGAAVVVVRIHKNGTASVKSLGSEDSFRVKVSALEPAADHCPDCGKVGGNHWMDCRQYTKHY